MTRGQQKVRARSVNVRRLTLRDREVARALCPPVDDLDIERPVVRADCESGERPCPFVSCKHHLYLDVTGPTSIKLNFPHLEVWELDETCALDVADRGGVTLEEIGEVMNITRERIRQVEGKCLSRLKRVLKRGGT